MNKVDKKSIKAEEKRQKKEAKQKAKVEKGEMHHSLKSSRAVKFAEAIKGILYLILAVSLLLAIILGQSGVIITLDDIINNLILAWTGKVVLVILAGAFIIYGLQQLKIIK